MKSTADKVEALAKLTAEKVEALAKLNEALAETKIEMDAVYAENKRMAYVTNQRVESLEYLRKNHFIK